MHPASPPYDTLKPMPSAGRVVVGRAGVRARRATPAPLAGLALLLLLPTASCVPATSASRVASAPAPAPVISPAAAATIASFTAPPATEAAPPTLAAIVATGLVPGTAPAINASIPFTGGPNPAAAAFFHRAGIETQARALQCMTEVIYYEAASESDDGQRAVAQVVLNRMRHPAYPASVCGVVYQNAHRWLACQFSFACDGARARVPSASGWARARAHAAQALAGRVYAPVGLATHYHTWNVVPHWARVLEKSAVVGAHIFYRLNGTSSRAFGQRYAGIEPAAVPFRLPPPVSTPMLAFAPLVLEKTAELMPGAPVTVRSDAVAVPEILTVAKPVPSPIMTAVEGSTVREEFRNSGAIRPEFARQEPNSSARPD